jgi:carboxypeptidase Q
MFSKDLLRHGERETEFAAGVEPIPVITTAFFLVPVSWALILGLTVKKETRSLRHSFVVLAVTVSVLHAAAAETPDDIAARLARNALRDSGALEIVTDLTTEVGARPAGSEAEKRAADWARHRCEQLGFENARIESFPLEHGWVRGTETAEITSPSPQRLIITALGGSIATPPDGIEAEIALFHTYDDLLAAPDGSLQGKIAVVTEPMVRAQDGQGYGAAVKIRHDGPGEAARRGAVAFLLRSLGTDSDRLPHTGVTDFTPKAGRIPCAALSVPDAEQLERLAAKRKPVRIKLLLTPRDSGPVTSQNVIAEIRGREKPEEIVLLGAHLDSWDLGTGAIDDGAGVAIVMAAAKLIRDLPQLPKRSLRIVLFGSEETGLFGGKAYAAAHGAEAGRHVIVGEPDFGQGPVYQFRTGVANPDEPSLKRIRAVLATLGVVAGDNGSKGDSDVHPLVELGVPAATLKLDGMDYFDLHHTANDTVDKIKPERINQSTAAFAVFAYLAAELDGDYRAKPAAPAK